MEKPIKLNNKFIRVTKKQLNQLLTGAKPYSFEEYFCLSAIEGLRALEQGNYGIGAIYIYRKNNKEYIIGGHNRMISGKNTGYHAEEDVINAFEGLANGRKEFVNRIIKVRKSPEKKESKILVTSLEPCIGCLQRILSHKFNEVWIGAEDPPSGAMLGGRDKGMPKIWQEILQQHKLKVILRDGISNKLRKILFNIFDFNRTIIDKKLKKQGLLNTHGFVANVNKFINDKVK